MADNRPLHELLRELASAPSADPADRVPVARESLRAWADRIEELEAACDTTRDQIEREAIDLQREFGPDDEDVQRLFAWSERLRAALTR